MCTPPPHHGIVYRSKTNCPLPARDGSGFNQVGRKTLLSAPSRGRSLALSLVPKRTSVFTVQEWSLYLFLIFGPNFSDGHLETRDLRVTLNSNTNDPNTIKQLTLAMAEETPERQAGSYLPPHARSQNSNNWRLKDDTPKADKQPNFRSSRGPQSPPADGVMSPTSASSDALAGTRLYVGNLLYTASREDVENLFTSNGFNITGISMSIDPFTNRNPSYAFVDFETPEEASKAMDSITGQELLGREVKVNPGVRRQPGQGGERRVKNFANGTPQQELTPRESASSLVLSLTNPKGDNNYSPSYNRWTRTDGPAHTANAQTQGLRLYVGNLPRIEPQSACEETIQQIFNSQGFEVAAVSKIISPHQSKAEEPGNHYYCFVDMHSAEDTDAAAQKLNGIETDWGTLRIGHAKGTQQRRPEREREGSDRRERHEERPSWR